MRYWLLLGSLCFLLGPAWARDRQAPTIQIMQPTTQAVYSTTMASVILRGTAHDNVSVQRVIWRTDRGASGTAQGTTSWQVTLTLPAGTTRVTMTAVDAAGNSGQDVLTITVVAPPPPSELFARLDATPTSGAAPLTVQFIDSSDGSHNAWAWTFGDGGTSTLQGPQYTYQAPGTYTVSLTIQGSSGGTSTATRVDYIVVSGVPPPPMAGFTATPTSGAVPLVVQFTDTSQGSPTSWAWTFGDGTTSALQSPSHTYQNAGTYTVSLTARNAGGATTVTQSALITGSAGPPNCPAPCPITIDWAYGATTGDAFQMERCTNSAGQPCPMAPVAAIALQDRTWVDQNVQADRAYCYRMAVTTAGQMSSYSNTMCSP